jgi:hypothetical protein
MGAQGVKTDTPSTEPVVGSVVEAVVTLPSEELAWARARAEREGTTVSAVVTDSVRKARQAEAWAEVLPALLEGQPPITDEEMRAAEREWKG